MANPNEHKNDGGLSPAIRDQLAIMKQAPVLFNSAGLIPASAGWVLTIEQMEDAIQKTAIQYLGASEVKYVTVNCFNKREPLACVWLRKDSKHLVDKSAANDPDLLVKVEVSRYSEELKRFADNFAPTHREDGTPINRKKRIQLVREDRGNKDIIAVKVDINLFLARLFDVDNKGFMDTYGQGASARRVVVDCSIIYDNRRNSSGEKKPIAFKIEKSFEGDGLMKGRNKPVPAFRG